MSETNLILLAEDEDNDAFFIARAFQKRQILNPLQRVKDGEEAITYLKGEGKFADRKQFPLPILMVMDLKMPRLSGFEVIAWVRQQPVIKRLPIVVLTSSRENPDINRAYELGANTYLVKPVDFEGLVDMIERLNLFWLITAAKPECSPP